MRLALCFGAIALVLSACSADSSVEPPVVAAGAISSTTSTVPATAADDTTDAAGAESAVAQDSAPFEGAPKQFSESYEMTLPAAFNGRAIPQTVETAEGAAALFVSVERALRIDGQDESVYADLGHTEQVLIRTLMRNSDWLEPFRAALPEDLLVIADLHIEARTELGLLHAGSSAPPLENIPAWEIIEPEPLEQLVKYYRAAGAETGIDWRILAGINLVETGMGRIDGLSSAGAQGPMQFLPSTWEEVSDGGDIDDPADAIPGAARYLVQRGGIDDIRRGLFGYNNSDNYVNAVLAYSELVALDERTLRGFYNWEIYVGTAEGTLWLPVGFRTAEPTPAVDYLAENPWALTLK